MLLNAQGIGNSRGAEWNPTTLYRWLDTGFAAGLLHTASTGGAHRGRAPVGAAAGVCGTAS